MLIRTELPVQLGSLRFEDLTVTVEKAAFSELTTCAADYRRRFGDIAISEVPGVQEARHLFRLMGIEPTKHRPASEALLRRALKDKPLYSVNSLVDVCNWCALDSLLPNGVYDYAKINGNITLRAGLEGEEYFGLTHEVVHLAGRYTLADDEGPFGSPKTDSVRTAVDLNTHSVLIVVYATRDFPAQQFNRCIRLLAERVTCFCGGREIRA